MISCPRCKNENVKTKEREFELQGKTVQVDEHHCPDCRTVFYFQEAIITYLQVVADNTSKQKGKN